MYFLLLQEAIPIRLKQVHVINAPAYISKIHAICKPFIKTEVAKLVSNPVISTYIPVFIPTW
jgi:hypothetical protein